MTYSKKTKQIRVSIVLPVYNEADHIAACLHAIARQTVRPYEVLVVDNNSADATAAIAASFPFVRIIREARQGVVYARNTGFNAARGDVIGRIDADTVIADNWVATLQTIFIQKGVDAIGGKVSYYDMARADVLNMIDLYCRRRLARLLDPEIALQGANMALRLAAWQKVRGATCSIGGLHEDFDLSIHLARARLRVGFDERLHASIGFRQAECNWREFTNYALLSPRTYARHGLKSQRHMYPIVLLGIIFYGPLWVLHHGYDRERGKFRLRLLTATAMRRVNPATFVD